MQRRTWFCQGTISLFENRKNIGVLKKHMNCSFFAGKDMVLSGYNFIG